VEGRPTGEATERRGDRQGEATDKEGRPTGEATVRRGDQQGEATDKERRPTGEATGRRGITEATEATKRQHRGNRLPVFDINGWGLTIYN
jgi:hypothetical protein